MVPKENTKNTKQDIKTWFHCISIWSLNSEPMIRIMNRWQPEKSLIVSPSCRQHQRGRTTSLNYDIYSNCGWFHIVKIVVMNRMERANICLIWHWGTVSSCRSEHVQFSDTLALYIFKALQMILVSGIERHIFSARYVAPLVLSRIPSCRYFYL